MSLASPLNLLPPEETRRLARRRVAYFSLSLAVVTAFGGLIEYLVYRSQIAGLREEHAREMSRIQGEAADLLRASETTEEASPPDEGPDLAPLREKSRELQSRYEERVAKERERLAERDDLRQFLTSPELRAIATAAPTATEVLVLLGNAAQGNVWIQSVLLDLPATEPSSRDLVVQGEGPDMVAFRAFLSGLVSAPFESKWRVDRVENTKKVFPAGPAGTEGFEREVVVFQITIRFQGD